MELMFHDPKKCSCHYRASSGLSNERTPTRLPCLHGRTLAPDASLQSPAGRLDPVATALERVARKRDATPGLPRELPFK